MGKIALTACSNSREKSCKNEVIQVQTLLEQHGFHTTLSRFFYSKTPLTDIQRRKGRELEGYIHDPAICAVMDLSGGDGANLCLQGMDLSRSAQGQKPFFAFSDTSVLLNILTECRLLEGVYFPVRNCLHPQAFSRVRSILEKKPAPPPPFTFLQGTSMEGGILGGNIRCFLKTAGTGYFPNMKNKILFLESRSADEYRFASYFRQLQDMGVISAVSGILIGECTFLEKKHGARECRRFFRELTQETSLPVAKTAFAGHGAQALPLVFGRSYTWESPLQP
jgi:muramoyltetrapeptide carboxypeptidase LdcA involved in peptidoglycan recycling